MYSIALWLRHCVCGPTAHKRLKSPKMFTNLPEITTDICLNCESQGEKGRTFILFLWDGTHWANFNEKVHKPQIKSYGSLCANMQYFLCVSASQLFGLLGTFYITKYCIQNCIILIILLLSCILDFCQKIPSSQVSNLIPTTEATYCREFGILSCFKAA